jgi:hypothetical protein
VPDINTLEWQRVGTRQCSPEQLPMVIFPKRIKLLPVYVLAHFVDAMQVFDGIICKKLLVLSIAEE